MNNIKAKINSTGFGVHIINSLNGGMEYADLEADLKGKGCNLSQTDLHNYHQTMKYYGSSPQAKPKAENGKIEVIGDIGAVIKQMQATEAIEPKKMLQMLYRLLAQQVQIVTDLQQQHLQDEMVLINNELKNLETIQKVYKSTLEINFKRLSWDGVNW